MDSKNNKNNKFLYENINCKYILELILNNLRKNIFLNLIKYNKKIQSKLEITLKDYKRYAKIEIEAIPAKGKHGIFINIPIGEDETNFHIYFNDNKNKVTNRCFYPIDNVKKIKIVITHQVKSLSGLFEDVDCIEKICFKRFYSANITNMCRMFSWCSSLKEADLTKFNTENVTDMSCMFAGCESLKKIIISDFKTDKVQDMSFMFSGCELLKSLNISKLNINKKANITDMFNRCYKLKIDEV